MNEKISTEDIKRQMGYRILGAIFFTVISLWLLPKIFNHFPDEQQGLETQPKRATTSLSEFDQEETQTLPPTQKTSPTNVTLLQPQVKASQPEKPPALPIQSSKPKTSTPPVTGSIDNKKKQEVKAKTFTLQAGVFSSKKRAHDLQAQLLLKNFPAYINLKKTRNSELYFLRLGPFTDEKQAKKVSQQLTQMQIKNFILPPS